MFRFNHITQYHSTLDKLNFSIGWASQVKDSTHLTKRLGRLTASPLNIHLQKSVTRKLRSNPHSMGGAKHCRNNNKQRYQELFFPKQLDRAKQRY